MNLWWVVWKEFIHLRRDGRTLFLTITFPALLLIIYGYALNFDVRHVRLGVVDHDRTPASRAYVASLVQGGYFDPVAQATDQRGLEALLDGGEIAVGLVIPAGFGLALERREPIGVQALVDGSNANSATTALGYLNAFTLDHMSRLAVDVLRRAGATVQGLPLDVRLVVYYNPGLESVRFLVPGLIGIILTVMAVVSTTMSVVREKERGTMENLAISPLRAWELVVGKTIPYLALGLFTSALILAVASGVFGVGVRGSLPLLFGVLVLFLTGALGLGVLVSTITDNQQVAFSVSMNLTLLPSFMLSDFIFPLSSMPTAVQAISYLMPSRYINEVLRAIILKGEGVEAFAFDLWCLAAFAVITVSLASLRVRRSMR